MVVSSSLPISASKSLDLQKLQQQVLAIESQLKSEHPRQADLILTALNERLLTPPTPISANQTNKQQTVSQPEEQIEPFHADTQRSEYSLSTEEKQVILDKLSSLGQQPQTAGKDELLYLEQQLADWLQLDVSSSYEDITLPYYQGLIEALPHLKQSPTDSLSKKLFIQEAGISSQRSFFGWQHQNGQSRYDSQDEYLVGLPLFHLESWRTQFQKLSKRLINHQMLVINPSDSILLLARVHNIYFHPNNKYQFGGSPRLIREGNFWSPQNMGKAIVFFVNQNLDTTKLGKIKI